MCEYVWKNTYKEDLKGMREMSTDLWKEGRGVNRQVGPRKLIEGEEPHGL